MRKRAQAIAAEVMQAPEVEVFCHIDTDGITGGSIVSEALERAGIEHRVNFLRRLDEEALRKIKNSNPPLAWFVDFGAGQLHLMEGLRAVITDHHIPTKAEISRHRRGDITAYAESSTEIFMLNPHEHGLGSDSVSGAGCAYLLAREMSKMNEDLAAIAVVGAVGDVQDREHRRLEGVNREIVHDGQAAEVLNVQTDLRFFGRETRPLHKLLEYASDPFLPRLSGNEEASIAFCLELGVELKSEERWRAWRDLGISEKRLLLSELVRLMLSRGFSYREVHRLIGEVYILSKETEGTPLRDAKEFATLVNACGRYDQAEVAYRVCRGDREEWLKKAMSLLRNHRETIVESLGFISEIGIARMENLQYFHAADKIRDTVVGIAAGMALSNSEADRDLPLIAFAVAEDGIKVSARASKELVDRGLDLSEIMRIASQSLGGQGGGHKIAAGATIPPGSEEEFLGIVNRMVAEQLARGREAED